MKLSELARDLKPYLLPWVKEAAGSVTIGTGGLSAHALNGTYHTGQLAESQAPWAVTNTTYAAHVANVNAHHSRQHDVLSTSDHTITGAALSLVGATAVDTLGVITPSNNPGTTEAVLKATGGLLTLPNFTATTKVTTPHAGSPSAFTSGFTGAGYRLDDGLATAGKTTLELDEMIVRGRMRVYELLIHQIRATNGSVFVTGVGKAKTVTGSGPYTIVTETDHGFAANDLIRAQRFTGSGVYQSNLQVTGVATSTQFTATLSSGDAPAAGMEFVRLGNTTDATRQGSIYLTADDTFAPAIDILDGVASFAEWGSASKIKVRLGKLTAGLDATLSPTGYGLYSQNVFLRGDLVAASGAVTLTAGHGADLWGWKIQTGDPLGRNRGLNFTESGSAPGANAFARVQGWQITNAGGTVEQNILRLWTGFPTLDTAVAQLRFTSLSGAGSALLDATYTTVQGSIQTRLGNTPGATIIGGASITAENHLLPDVDVTKNLGSAVLRWGTLYVDQIIAGAISGTTMNGAEWEYAGSMIIDANSASNTTISVVNQGAGQASLDVEKDIVVGGLVDGVDVAAFKSSYDSHIAAGDPHGGYLLATGERPGATSQAQIFSNGITGPTWKAIANSPTAIQIQNTATTSLLTVDTLYNRVIVNPTGLTETALNGPGLIIGNTVQRDRTSLYINSFYPTIAQRARRASTGFFAFSAFAMSAESTTTALAADLAEIGAYGAYNTAPTAPTLSYLYLSSLPSPAYNNANFFLNSSGRIGVGANNTAPTAALDIVASVTTAASLRLRAGTAPSAPNSGDIWHSGTSFSFRAGSTTYNFGATTTVDDIEMTGELLAANGSVSAPSIAALSDTNTGLYWSAADTLAVTTGGAQRAIFSSAGLTVPTGKINASASGQAHILNWATIGTLPGWANWAGFGHSVAATDITGIALAHAASGDTVLNGRNLTLHTIGASEIWRTTASGLQSQNYVSQTTGWRLASPSGAADLRYLFTDEMHAKSIIADLQMALAGGQIITPSVAELYSTFTCPDYSASTTLTVRDLPSAAGMQVFPNGTIVRVANINRAGGTMTISAAWGTVTLDTTYGVNGFDAATKSQRYTFARPVALYGGGMSAGTTVAPDAIILCYGVSGNGYIETNAVDGLYGANSPYTQIATWVVHPAFAQVRSRWGNLNGLSIADFGLVMGSDVGAAATRTFDFRASTGNLALGANGGAIMLQGDGSSYFSGAMTIGSSGGIYQGSGTFGAPTTGLKIWNDSGTGRIGGYNAGYLQWYANTDGKLYAGGGNALLDSNGISVIGAATLRIMENSSTLKGYLYSSNPLDSLLVASTGVGLKTNGAVTAESISLRANATGGRASEIAVEGTNNSGTNRIRLLCYSGSMASSGQMTMGENFFSLALGGTGTTDFSVASDGDTYVGGDFEVAGNITGTWNGLTLTSGWGNYGAPHAAAGYRSFGNLVLLRGLVVATSGSPSTHITTLPSGRRPAAQMICTCMTNGGAKRIDVKTNGDIVPISWTPALNDWISLDNIIFYTN